MARELSGNLAHTVPAMKRWFTGYVSKYCHPCFGVDGSSK